MDCWPQIAHASPAQEVPCGHLEPQSRMVSIALARAQAGDRCAFTFLYVRYADDIYEFARSIVNDCAEAQDITRQVFAELIGMIGEYQEREAPFLPWLQRVARNVAVDHLRAPCPPLAQEVSASTNVVPRRVSR